MLLRVLLMVLTQAPADRIRVDWLAPEGCPDRAALASRLEASVAPGRTFAASVRIEEPSAPGLPWRAVVLTNLGDGQRSRLVEAPDCGIVTEAAVLVITLAATSVAAEPAPEPMSRATLPPALKPPAPSSHEPGPEQPGVGTRLGNEVAKPFHLQVMPRMGANVGVLPLPGLSFGLGLALGRGALRGEIAVFQWLESETPGNNRGARLSMTSAALEGCWLFEPRPSLYLGPCVGAEVGVMGAQGRRIIAPAEASSVWVAGLMGATMGLETGVRVRPWVNLEVGANFVRPSFLVSTPLGDVVVHSVFPAVGRVTVGLEVTLP